MQDTEMTDSKMGRWQPTTTPEGVPASCTNGRSGGLIAPESLVPMTMKGKRTMGTYAKNPRTKRVTIRFTEKEMQMLEAAMKDAFYLSPVRYIRDAALGRRVVIRRNVVLTDNQLRRQINDLTAQIAAIGVDYNQATKRFHSLITQKRADGSPVLNARAANTYLNRVYALTADVKQKMEDVIETVDSIGLPKEQDIHNQ